MTTAAMQKATTTVPVTVVDKHDNLFNHWREISREIARRAFGFFEANGYKHGHDLEHWFRAESEFFKPVPLEMEETNEAFTIKAEVPGFTEKDLQVKLEPTRAFITGQRQKTTDEKQGKTIYKEEFSDELFRCFELPDAIATNKGTAVLKDGVLTLSLPKMAATLAIPVKAA